MAIEAIISDADGTLVNTLHLIRHGQYETAKAYLAQNGVAPPIYPATVPTSDCLINRLAVVHAIH